MSRAVAGLAALSLAGACDDGPTGLDSGVATTSEIMTLVPRAATIQPGKVVFLRAKLIDALGKAVPGIAITWTSSNEAVARVSAAGEVFGRAEGRALIVASASGKTQVSTIHVLLERPRKGQKPDVKQKPTMDPGRLEHPIMDSRCIHGRCLAFSSAFDATASGTIPYWR
jgi:hypothetical protein